MDTSILLIYTGGTIGMRPDESGTLVPFDFNDIYDEFPSLRKPGVNIDTLPFTPIDSSNVTPELWVTLAGLVRDNYERYDGFVVLHGTDTMSYTASALSFMLENLDKPVVFTGSQIPIGIMRTDGRENLITAIEIAMACAADGRPAVPEVSLYFQNALFRANRTIKYSAEELDAFRSENYPHLAEVGVKIHFDYNNIDRTERPGPLRVHTALEDRVAVVRIFPGMREEMFRAMLSVPGLRGIVLETYGAGNAPTAEWFLDAVSEAVAAGIAVLNVTQCPSGSVADIYETGVALTRAGVIGGRDMTTEAALTKMMCLLGAGLLPEELRRLLREPIRGEMTV